MSDQAVKAVDQPRIPLPMEKIADFCDRWGISEFALFGSVLRDDFGPASDVDVMVTLGPGKRYGFFEIGQMEDELQELFGRRVDVVTRKGIEISRRARWKSVLDSVKVIYVSA